MPLCPNQHESRATDFCEVCGVEMTPAAGGESSPSGHVGMGTGEMCPACHTEREAGGGDFCEVCGYNFKTGAGVPIPSAQEPAGAEPMPEAAPSVPQEAPAISAPTFINLPKWELVISVAAVPHAGMPDGALPPAFTERVMALEADTLLIGRRSARRNLAPEISLDHDDGVSHQHARLERREGGGVAGYWLLDLGSSNGTTVNGLEMKPPNEAELRAGDVVEVGRWTRLTVRMTNDQ